MNAFSRQGKALPSEVRNQIEKYLSNEGIANISRQSNLPCKYERRITTQRSTILLTVLYGKFDCRDIFDVPLLLNHFSIILFLTLLSKALPCLLNALISEL